MKVCSKNIILIIYIDTNYMYTVTARSKLSPTAWN
jgi:hypothetical protein